jgi:hypothetical protein
VVSPLLGLTFYDHQPHSGFPFAFKEKERHVMEFKMISDLRTTFFVMRLPFWAKKKTNHAWFALSLL